MGGSAGKQEFTQYSRCTITVVNSGISDFDKIFLLVNDVVEHAEQIRYNVMNSRECLFRITKTHLYKEANLTDTFKVWSWAVGACNEESSVKAQFKADWNDYSNPIVKLEAQGEIVEQVKNGIMSNIGQLMDAGKNALAKANDIIKGTQTLGEPKIVFAMLGSCADFKLRTYPKILANYIEGIKLARDQFAALDERLNYLVQKIIAIKKDKKELISMLEGLEGQQKKIIAMSVGANLGQFERAKKICEGFLKLIPGFVIELQSFMDNYAVLFAQSSIIAKQVYKNIGVRPYYNDAYKLVLRGKMQAVASMLSYRKDGLLAEADKKFKEDRKSRRPKAQGDEKFNDTLASETIFPSRYRWMDSQFFDTHFSALSITFSELEIARKNGGLAQKEMFKLTSAGKLKDKSIASAFEVFTWSCSDSLNGKLGDLQMKLLPDEPWIGGKDIENVVFNSEAEVFRKNLLIWLNAYAPIRYTRLQDHWNDIQVRIAKIDACQFDIIEYTKELHPSDVYSALSSLSKNLLCNIVYVERSNPLYQEITMVQGKQGIDLYARQEEILSQADIFGIKCKGTPMKYMVAQHVEGRIGNSEYIQKRKEENKKAKEERSKKKHLLF